MSGYKVRPERLRGCLDTRLDLRLRGCLDTRLDLRDREDVWIQG